MYYIILFLTLSNIIVCSTISSYIVDSIDNTPIEDVIVICGKNKTTTDKDGYFKINSSENSRDIILKHIKYNTITISIDEIKSIIKLNSQTFFLNVKVYGSLNDNTLFKENSSVTVLTKESLNIKTAEHFEDILPLAPNLTYSGASSRPRFFQIRGIGEKSQYFGEGGPNYSVGLLIDNIDFSGIGMIANTFDIEQVEFFNGSQSYLYGPNSLAGMINITSKTPSLSKEAKVKTGISNYGGNMFGILLSGPVSAKSFYSLTYHQNYNDGYKYNQYRNIKNSNMKDEKYLRLKYHIINNSSSIKISHMIADYNNLYDDWTPDNNYKTTYSDSIGKDSQYTYATSFNFNKEINKTLKFALISTFSKNKLIHSYDGDWANDEYWISEHDMPNNWSWSFTDNTSRYRNSKSLEFRVNKNYQNYISNLNNLTFGYYQSNTDETDKSNGWIFGGEATNGESLYKIQNKSFYVQLKDYLKDNLYFQINYRYEHSDISYNGSFNQNTQQVDSKQTFDMSGYKLSLNHSFKNINTFVSYSKGYKNGGINQSHLIINEDSRFYNPEYTKNIELGFKYQNKFIQGSFTYFYMSRENQHLFLSDQIDNPNNFFFYSINANDGINKGFEFQNHLFLSKKSNIQTSLSYLSTFIDKVIILDDTLLNRESSYAPKINYTFIFNNLLSEHLTFSATIYGKSSYYLSDNHNAKSNGYNLFDINIQHKKNNLTFNVWIKNLNDKRYPIKAFYFALIPPGYVEDFYYQYNKPRTYGINLTYDI